MIALTNILVKVQEHCLWPKQNQDVLMKQTPVSAFGWDYECIMKCHDKKHTIIAIGQLPGKLRNCL